MNSKQVQARKKHPKHILAKVTTVLVVFIAITYVLFEIYLLVKLYSN